MISDQSLRAHLQKLLDWEDAHANFDAAVKGIGPDFRAAVPKGLPYSPWQLVEHLRAVQHDILGFCRNGDYTEPPFEEFWPKAAAPPSAKAWNESIAAFRRDRESLKQLADDTPDLCAKIPHGAGQTYLRELLLAADHCAYHVGELIVVRRCLGIWDSA